MENIRAQIEQLNEAIDSMKGTPHYARLYCQHETFSRFHGGWWSLGHGKIMLYTKGEYSLYHRNNKWYVWWEVWEDGIRICDRWLLNDEVKKFFDIPQVYKKGT